jgi:hypothetical protein
VIGDNADRYIDFFFFIVLRLDRIFCTGDAFNFPDQRREDIGVVVRLYALQNHAKTLESHSGVDVLRRQFFKRAVGLAVEFHEHVVPYLDNLRMVGVDELFSILFRFFVSRTDVDVDFRARPARTLVAHFPEIVFLIAEQNAVFGDQCFPDVVCFLVERHIFFLAAFENGHI